MMAAVQAKTFKSEVEEEEEECACSTCHDVSDACYAGNI
jgi:hypothetical protein